MTKKYIKNITGEKGTKYPIPVTLAFKEDGKKIELKAGEQTETKMNGTNISGNRLVLITEEKTKLKKDKEVE